MVDNPVETITEEIEEIKPELKNYMLDQETNELIEVENIHQISMLNESNIGMTFSMALVLLMVIAVMSAAYSISRIGD